MYKINIFDNINIKIDWYMVYWGIKHKVLSLDVAKDYACKRIEIEESISDEELELSWKSEDFIEVLDTIERIPDFQCNNEEKLNRAKFMVRIAIIIYLRKTELDIVTLLEKIDMIYADFDYPTDMEKFISYMPIDDKDLQVKHAINECRSYLLEKLDLFINEQIKKLELFKD
ncbi:DUF2247 family protein [Anaerosporobacter faecicola]|uniref:DUF2247 family protein n=1 Tax=Anaerosporobacter faecicola TaxID=2718714 RepID=UPI001438E2B6|nr:DUF2247 family protein [Anaerosporobacter faecicola]